MRCTCEYRASVLLRPCTGTRRRRHVWGRTGGLTEEGAHGRRARAVRKRVTKSSPSRRGGGGRRRPRRGCRAGGGRALPVDTVVFLPGSHAARSILARRGSLSSARRRLSTETRSGAGSRCRRPVGQRLGDWRSQLAKGAVDRRRQRQQQPDAAVSYIRTAEDSSGREGLVF